MGLVRFILGRAATGKTHHLVGRIAALCRADPLGPPVYWLVPKQATFQAERLLTCTLGGFARVRVVDFGRLGQAVLDACGGVGIPEVTPAGRRMVIGHLLRANRGRLKYYNHSADRPGLAAELDATFDEFERSGLDAAGLDALLPALTDDADDGLRLKLADVRLLLDAYAAHIGSDKLDPAQRMARILDKVAGCPALKDAALFVDDFYDFTVYERKLLAAVAGTVSRTEIALLLDPDDPAAADPNVPPGDLSVFHRTLRAYRGLRAAFKGVPIEPPLTLRTVRRPPALAAVERDLFTPAVTPGAAVDFFDAPDPRAEVDAVARRIRAAVADGTTRYRDVALLVRSLADYREIVHASFGEHGIPYFADHRRPAHHHPLMQMVRTCLQIARSGWPTDAAITLAKCGLTGLTDDGADELENYVLRHRLRGPAAWESPDDWRFGRRLPRHDDAPDVAGSDAAKVDAFRRSIAGPLAPLTALARGGPAAVRTIAATLFGVLEAFDVRTTLARWLADADPERRGEHEQVWTELTALFDQMVDVIGGAALTVADFLAVLDSGLEGFDLALAPATVDQVLLGEVDRTRTPNVKLVFVLGLAEGRFPVARREELVLSDAERRTLRKRQIDLDDDTERRLLDERFLAYVAFTRPTARLIVSRPLADDAGRAANPSAFWAELQRLCPAPVDHVPRPSADAVDTIGTPRQLVDALMRWVRADAPAGDGTLPALYDWLRTRPDPQAGSELPRKPGSPVDAPDPFAAPVQESLAPSRPLPADVPTTPSQAAPKPDGPDGPSTATALVTLRRLAWPALSYANRATLDPARAAALFPVPMRATVRQLEDAAACPFRHFAKHGLLLTARPSADVTGVDLHNAYHQVIENLTADLLAQHVDWTGLTPAAAADLIGRHAADVGRLLREQVLLSTARGKYLLDHIERTLTRSVASLTETHRRGRYRPRWANLRFGTGLHPHLPPFEVVTPAGRAVRLHGHIDRVDLNDKGGRFVVNDYRLAPGALALDKVYYGLSLQLLTYLLVVQAGGEQLTGHKLAPAAAFLCGLLHPPKGVDHPDEAMPATHADFHLQHKPRGLIDDRAVDSLDQGGAAGYSPVVAAFRKNDGTLGMRHNTDVATAAEFAGLMKLVEARLGEAADRVTDGDVAVHPYRLGRQTPCGRCEYRTVCRFEPGVNTYRPLTPLRRDAVLARVTASAQPETDSAG